MVVKLSMITDVIGPGVGGEVDVLGTCAPMYIAVVSSVEVVQSATVVVGSGARSVKVRKDVVSVTVVVGGV